ncbi:WD40 repeat domain-containing serine/threonine protein kinase [Embleya sp. NPDC008237]|uniref:WD40 repeat domain-containing serine/threonine protein kinase n=1 Tax=Embleya sp. NPDC008237 TaxID=3363978 RepID=UPI0036DFE95F
MGGRRREVSWPSLVFGGPRGLRAGARMTGGIGVWHPGQVVLDRYEVLRTAGVGGMGVVYQVRHLGWDHVLAVKVPRREVLGSPHRVAAFEREAEAWAHLGLHPHTVHCAYTLRVAGLLTVFAEWVDGGSLDGVIRSGALYRDGPERALARVLDVGVQFAWGLDHAHRSGLVHQDVKPANVMLTADGVVKVTDFGLAKARSEVGGVRTGPPTGGPDPSFTVAGLTPAYSSPEQTAAARGEPIRLTRATDIWSWAVSVLEMFAGRRLPGQGPDAPSALVHLVRHGAVDPSVPPLRPDVADLLARCLRFEPGERPASLTEVADELVAIHEATARVRYSRPAPKPADLIGDSLSNHALSALDLGDEDRATDLWEQSAQRDPHHPHTVYNRGLHAWRAGRLTDAQLLDELAAVRDTDPRDRLRSHLLGLLHLELNDRVQAAALLRDASDATAVRSLRRASTVRPPRVLVPETTSAESLAIAPGARVALTGRGEHTMPTPPGSEGGAVRVWGLVSGTCLHAWPAHPRTAYTVALSDDGTRAASGGDDGTVRVWETDTGRPLHSLPAHTGPVESVAWSPCGRRIVSATPHGSLIVWDVDSGRPVRELQPHDATIHGFRGSAVFAPDGESVVRWEAGQARFRVWEIATGRLIRSQRLYRCRVALGHHGRVALAKGDDGMVTLWAPLTGRKLGQFEGHPFWGEQFAVDADGRRALTTGPLGAQLWDLDTGRCLRTLRGHGRNGPVAISPDGGVGLCCSADGVRVWDLLPLGPTAPWSYARPHEAAAVTGAADAAATALDQAELLAQKGEFAAAAGRIRAARDAPGHERHRPLADRWAELGSAHGRRVGLRSAWHQHTFEAGNTPLAVLSPDGRLSLTAATPLHSAVLWDNTTGLPLHTLRGHTEYVRRAVFAPDGRTVFTGDDDDTIMMWDTATGKCLKRRTGHRGLISVAMLLPDSRHLASALGDLTNAYARRAVREHRGFITSAACTPDGHTVVTGGVDATARVWHRSLAHRAGPVLADHTETVTCVAVDATGEMVLTGSCDKTARLWSLATGRCLHVLRGHHDDVVAVTFAPDGRTAHTSSVDGTLCVWDLANGRAIMVLTGHTGLIKTHLTTPDGRAALTAGNDGTIRIWDLSRGTALRVLTGHTNRVTDIALSHDCRTLLSGSWDNTARLWYLDWDYDFRTPAPRTDEGMTSP